MLSLTQAPDGSHAGINAHTGTHMADPEKLKKLLEIIEQRGRELGYPSRRQLSIAATGNPETLNNLARGRMPRDETMRKIAHALGVTPRWLQADLIPRISHNSRYFEHSESATDYPMLSVQSPGPARPSVRDLPAYAATAGEQTGIFVLEQRIAEYLERPRALDGAVDAYAVYVADDAMAPRYTMGEVVYANPARPVTVGCYALVQLGESEALIARVDDLDGQSVTLRQFHQEKPIVYDRAVVTAMHRIVMGGEA